MAEVTAQDAVAAAGKDAAADACPKCYRTKTLHTNLRFMVSSCGHKICDLCMKKMLGNQGACVCYVKGCGTKLYTGSFAEQVFEDTGVQTEVTVRRKILAEFNKTEHDFDGLDAYNNYLEEVEDIIFSLVNKVGVDEANRRIEENRRENKRLIALNKQRQEEKDQLVRLQVEAEERMRRQAWKETFENIDQEKVEKRRMEDDLMKQIANVKDPARVKEIVETYRKRQQRRSIVAEGGRAASQQTTYSMVHKEPVPKALLKPYVYQRLVLDDDGPAPPTYEDVLADASIQSAVFTEAKDPAAALAGGLGPGYAAARALQEAYCCLYTTA